MAQAEMSSPINEGVKSLDIRTKTIEATLLPMLQQITILVNQRNHSRMSNGSEKSADLESVTSTVEAAVAQFVSAGEKVAGEYPAIQMQMKDACEQANKAGALIIEHAQLESGKELVAPARQLLAAIYKVLVLADSVVVKEIIQARDKVIGKLEYLSKVTNFTDFLNNFTGFGSDMAEFGKLTGERQTDMKKDLDAAKMACLRGFLEKCTVIYLTSCKVCLRHPTNGLAKDIRSTIVTYMNNALNEIVDIVIYSPSTATDDHEKILSKALREYLDSLEMCFILAFDSTSLSRAEEAFSLVDEFVHDFTDSAFTPHEHRELIILMCEKCKQQLDQLAEVSVSDTEAYENEVSGCKESILNLKQQLVQHTVTSAAELFGSSVDTGLLAALRSAAQNGEEDVVENISCQIRDHVDQIQEMSKQMQHVSPNDAFYIRVKYTTSYLLSLTELLLQSVDVYSENPVSKVAVEGYTTQADSWVMLIGELAAASEELQSSLNNLQ